MDVWDRMIEVLGSWRRIVLNGGIEGCDDMTEARQSTLAQVGVIVTRPEAQAQCLADLLEEQGARVLLFPTLKIETLGNSKLKQVVQDLDQYHHLIFTSVNAVENSLPMLESYWPQWPVKQEWYGVGDATATALEKYGIEPVVPPINKNSEGLLALRGLQLAGRERVCLFKGEAGRTLLQETLLQRGAELDEVICYRRVLAPKDSREQDRLKQFLQHQSTKFLIANSNESLDNFLLLAADQQYSLQELIVVAASERIGCHAQQSGFTKIAQAERAGDKSLLEAIREWCDNPRSSE